MFKKLISSHALRRRTSWVIAGVLILPFVLFFHATGRAPTQGPGGTAGVIFGKPVSWDVFQQERLWIRRQMESQLGDQELPEEIIGPLITQSTWNRLILLEEAKRLRLRVADQEIAAFIQQQIPAFQENGRFVPERYYRFLSATGMSPQLFEGRLRNDLLVQQLITTIKGSVVVTEDEVKAAYANAYETLNGSLILFDPASFADAAAAALTEDEVRARYDARPDEVRIPEQLMLEYAGASREELAAHTRVTDEEARAFYEDHQEQFTNTDGAVQPLEQVRDAARRQATDEQVRKQLKALALDLEEDVDARLRFEEIALTRALTLKSAGPVAAGNPLAAGELEPAVLNAVAGLRDGEVSGVIETDNGVYVARITQRVPSRVPPFDQVREGVRARLVQERAREAAKSAAEGFSARLKEARASGFRFEELVVKEGVVPSAVGPFTRTQPVGDLGYLPSLNDAAFATPPGEATSVIETPRGFVILRPEERIPADESRFAEAATGLRQDALTRAQSARLDEWLQEVRARAKLQSFVNQPPQES